MRVPANLVNGSNVQLTERLHECVVVNGVGQKAAEIFAGQSERLDQGWVFEVRVCRHHLGAEVGSRVRLDPRGARARDRARVSGDVQDAASFQGLWLFEDDKRLGIVVLAVEVEECQGAVLRKRDVQAHRNERLAVDRGYERQRAFVCPRRPDCGLVERGQAPKLSYDRLAGKSMLQSSSWPEQRDPSICDVPRQVFPSHPLDGFSRGCHVRGNSTLARS